MRRLLDQYLRGGRTDEAASVMDDGAGTHTHTLATHMRERDLADDESR